MKDRDKQRAAVYEQAFVRKRKRNVRLSASASSMDESFPTFGVELPEEILMQAPTHLRPLLDKESWEQGRQANENFVAKKRLAREVARKKRAMANIEHNEYEILLLEAANAIKHDTALQQAYSRSLSLPRAAAQHADSSYLDRVAYQQGKQQTPPPVSHASHKDPPPALPSPLRPMAKLVPENPAPPVVPPASSSLPPFLSAF